MTNATAEKPTKPVLSVPQFGTIPVEQFYKAPNTKPGLSAAKQAMNAEYDKFILAIPAGRAGVVPIPEGTGFRTIMGLVRGAVDRLESQGVTPIKGGIVHNKDKHQVEVKVNRA